MYGTGMLCAHGGYSPCTVPWDIVLSQCQDLLLIIAEKGGRAFMGEAGGRSYSYHVYLGNFPLMRGHIS